MSENSSNISNIDTNNNGKKVNYTTDYMVDYLKVSDKLVSPNNRKAYIKNKDDINYSDSSDNLESYISKNNVAEKYTSDVEIKVCIRNWSATFNDWAQASISASTARAKPHTRAFLIVRAIC